jgi:membrane protease YdiL (CAAX protease family)
VTKVGSRALHAVGADASATLRDTAKVIGWGLLLYGVVLLIGAKFSTAAIGSLALQVVVAEWGAGRLAVSWSDPKRPPPKLGDVARRIGVGLGAGLVAAAGVVVFGLATHGLSAHANTPEPSQLAIGLLVAALGAVRDELLLRGVPLRAFRHTCPPSVLLLVCGGAGAAAEYGLLAAGAEVSGVRVVVAALTGIAFASLWMRDRGGWLPLGAHTAWTLVTGGVIRGGLFDLRAAPGAWGGGDAGLAGSLAMVAALVPLAALAAAWSARASPSR